MTFLITINAYKGKQGHHVDSTKVIRLTQLITNNYTIISLQTSTLGQDRTPSYSSTVQNERLNKPLDLETPEEVELTN